MSGDDTVNKYGYWYDCKRCIKKENTAIDAEFEVIKEEEKAENNKKIVDKSKKAEDSLKNVLDNAKEEPKDF